MTAGKTTASNQCTYAFLSQNKGAAAELCKGFALKNCGSSFQYVNFFKIYYCNLGGQPFLLLAVIILVGGLTMLTMDYLRKAYLLRPLLRLRRATGISDNMAEALLIPLAFGIGPLCLRMQAGLRNLEPSFNFGASLASTYLLITLVMGMSAIWIGTSHRTSRSMLLIDFTFIVLAVCLYFGMGMLKSVIWLDGVVLTIIWLLYLLFVYISNEMQSKGKKTRLTHRKRRDFSSPTAVGGLWKHVDYPPGLLALYH